MTIAIPPKINETQHSVMLDYVDQKFCQKVFDLRKKIKPILGSVQKENTEKTEKIVWSTQDSFSWMG